MVSWWWFCDYHVRFCNIDWLAKLFHQNHLYDEAKLRTLCCIIERLHLMLQEDGGIRALLGMARPGNNEVVAQVARGIANFAKCESRGIMQGL